MHVEVKAARLQCFRASSVLLWFSTPGLEKYQRIIPKCQRWAEIDAEGRKLKKSFERPSLLLSWDVSPLIFFFLPFPLCSLEDISRSNSWLQLSTSTPERCRGPRWRPVVSMTLRVNTHLLGEQQHKKKGMPSFERAGLPVDVKALKIQAINLWIFRVFENLLELHLGLSTIWKPVIHLHSWSN